MSDKKAALFVDLDEDYGFGFDHVVITFDSEEDAVNFAVQKLVGAGELERQDDGLFRIPPTLYYDADLRDRDARDALEAWQDTLGMCEYFQVFDCYQADEIPARTKEPGPS